MFRPATIMDILQAGQKPKVSDAQIVEFLRACLCPECRGRLRYDPAYGVYECSGCAYRATDLYLEVLTDKVARWKEFTRRSPW